MKGLHLDVHQLDPHTIPSAVYTTLVTVWVRFLFCFVVSCLRCHFLSWCFLLWVFLCRVPDCFLSCTFPIYLNHVQESQEKQIHITETPLYFSIMRTFNHFSCPALKWRWTCFFTHQKSFCCRYQIVRRAPKSVCRWQNTCDSSLRFLQPFLSAAKDVII